MFKYNELSDLLTGELVVPIKKEGENIICLNSNSEEVIYNFDDFDFEKTIEERNFIVEDDPSEEETTEEEILEEKKPIISPRIEQMNNLLNITIKNWTSYNITLVGDIILPFMDEITIDVFEDSSLHEQLKNLAKKYLISFSINSSKKEKEIIPEKIYIPKEDKHFNKEAVAVATSLGYKFKDPRDIWVWTEEIY